jgi:hypothetical protein
VCAVRANSFLLCTIEQVVNVPGMHVTTLWLGLGFRVRVRGKPLGVGSWGGEGGGGSMHQSLTPSADCVAQWWDASAVCSFFCLFVCLFCGRVRITRTMRQ